MSSVENKPYCTASETCGPPHLRLRAALLIAMPMMLTVLTAVQINTPAASVPSGEARATCLLPAPNSHSCVCPCVHRKNSRSKKVHLFHHLPLVSASRAPFSRGVEWLLYGSGCSCQLQQVKTALKQATQRALFRGVTFRVGWGYFWKNVWDQNAFSSYYLIFFYLFFFLMCL